MAQSFENIAWLKQRLGSGCEEVPVQGDRPLLLDDPSCAYVTLSEHHQLFCVEYHRGSAVGRREHMARCLPGQLLFGLEPLTSAKTTALMLSGVSGSVVWRVSTARLLGLAAQPDGEAVIVRLFDGWIELLSQTLPHAPIPPRCTELRATEVFDSDGNQPLCSALGLLWVAAASPPRIYRGMDSEGSWPKAAYWPLSSRAWGVFPAEKVRAWSSTALLREGKSIDFAHGFYTFVVSVVSARRAELAKARLTGDVASRVAEQEIISRSLKQLASVGRAEPLAPERGGDDWERTLRCICDFLEIEAPQIVQLEGPTLAHMQTALSQVSGVRTRGVLLESVWRQHDGGPLLAFWTEEEDVVRPVALLPTRRGYALQDPESSAARPVLIDQALAARLHSRAYQFYVPLPNRPLAPLEVLGFSSSRAKSDLLFVALLGMATGALGTLIPLLTGEVFDRIIPGAERGLLHELTLVLLAVYLGEILFDLARGFALVRAQTRMDTRLEAGVWDRLLNLPLPFFRRYSAGDLADRAAGIGGISQVLAGATLSTLLAGVFSLWNFALLFYIDAKLALAASALVMISALAAAAAAHMGLRRQRRVAELDGKISGLLLQLLSGMAKLRVTGAENRAFGVWSKLFSRRRDADLDVARVQLRVGVFQASFPLICSMVLFWLLTEPAGQGLSTGQFLAFNTTFALFMASFGSVIDAGLQSLSVIPMYERARPILAEPVERTGSSGLRIELKGGIELSHVSFRYQAQGPLILDDVNLSIEPNEFVAIVGASGSGKSTLLRVLLGFESGMESSVFYDGQALATLDVRAVRQQIGVVLQNSRVLPGQIFNNIVGNTGLGIDAAWRAARQAALAQDIEAMPMGMHTVVGHAGGTLSGGQRQRLLIARALLSQPRILLFDEATSALDNRTQAMVTESLEGLRVTRVVIAHRLSTIRYADKIVVLDRGRIVQTGRFEALMQEEGAFRALAKRQM